MFDLGWTELLVIGIVALIVVGPKDLPVLFRRAGEFFGRMRGMAREFSRAMNDAADEAGVSDVQKTLKTASNPVKSAMDQVKDAAKTMTQFDPDSATGKLSAERAEAAAKIHAKAAEVAKRREEGASPAEERSIAESSKNSEQTDEEAAIASSSDVRAQSAAPNEVKLT